MATTQTLNATSSFPAFWRIQDWRLSTKLLAAFFLILTAPLVIIGVITVTRARDALLERGTTSLIASSNGTAGSIDHYLMAKREDIATTSKLPAIVNYAMNPGDATNKETATSALKASAGRTDYESIAFVNPEGTITASSADADVNTSVAFRPYFLEAMKGTVYISDPSVSVITNKPAIFFSAPVKNSAGKTLGVVRSRVSLDGIWSLVESDKNVAGPGTIGVLLDENGIRLSTSLTLGNRDAVASELLYTAVAPVSPDVEKQLVTEKRFGKSTETSVRVLPLPQISEALVTPGIKSFETSADMSTAPNYATIASMTTKPWRYVLMTPMSTFTGPADDLRLIFVVTYIIVGALAAILALFLARGLTAPILSLIKIADRISMGELDTKISIHRKDEIGELANAIGRMQSSLKGAIDRLRTRRAAS